MAIALTQYQREAINEACRRHQVARLHAFGSVVGSHYQPGVSDIDVLERDMAQITGWPDVRGRFDGPALFLTGALSDYVRPEHRDAIKDLFPKARFARIHDAGHWLHAERPKEFEAAVRAFLEAPEPTGATA
jgi:pimeloyl-ACP methyl ester carboxylesterase